MIPTGWKAALLDFSVDADNSEEVDLEGAYEFLTVIIPTLAGSYTTTVHVAMTAGGTYYPLYMFDTAAVGDFAQITDGATTPKAITFRIGGAQYIKVVSGTSLSADITFYVRGFNRG